MNNHHTSLYNSDYNKPDGNVLKQELVTYEQTEFGLKITSLERIFTSSEHKDNYTSTPLPLRQWDKPSPPAIEGKQKKSSQLFNDEQIVSVPSKDGRQA